MSGREELEEALSKDNPSVYLCRSIVNMFPSFGLALYGRMSSEDNCMR